jgi:hypothetical protein
VVVCSGGNSGPKPATVSNLAPWVLTVGASSIDRAFDSPIKLGNGVAIMVINKRLTVKDLYATLGCTARDI